MSVCLSVCASVHPCIRASVPPCFRASVHPWVRTSVRPCYRSSCAYVHPSIMAQNRHIPLTSRIEQTSQSLQQTTTFAPGRLFCTFTRWYAILSLARGVDRTIHQPHFYRQGQKIRWICSRCHPVGRTHHQYWTLRHIGASATHHSKICLVTRRQHRSVHIIRSFPLETTDYVLRTMF